MDVHRSRLLLSIFVLALAPLFGPAAMMQQAPRPRQTGWPTAFRA